MRCEECAQARKISVSMVFCRHFGIVIRKDYSGCISRWKERKTDGKTGEPEPGKGMAVG